MTASASPTATCVWSRLFVTESIFAQGAMFTITLPLTTASSNAALKATAAASPAMSLAGVSVLLVEDEDDTRLMLAAALQKFGAAVTAVSSALAALDVLRACQPHVVVSDIGMPGEDGCTMMVKIRSGAAGGSINVPAIALTAYARAEDRDRIQASGFGFHLLKPVDPMTFVRMVREAAGSARPTALVAQGSAGST